MSSSFFLHDLFSSPSALLPLSTLISVFPGTMMRFQDWRVIKKPEKSWDFGTGRYDGIQYLSGPEGSILVYINLTVI